jgi:hypothetical protein
MAAGGLRIMRGGDNEVLYQLYDYTRGECYTTDNEANVFRFLMRYRARHPEHDVEIWRGLLDGEGHEWERVA